MRKRQPRRLSAPSRRRPLAVGAAAALMAGAGFTAAVWHTAADHLPRASRARPPRVSPPAPPTARDGTGPPKNAFVLGGRRRPQQARVPWTAGGRYAVVPGTAPPPRGRRGTVIRYMVEVERGLPFSGPDFAAAVQRILNDPHGWGHGGRLRFARTDHGPVRIRVSLTSPALAILRCRPLDTGGQLSCWHQPRAIINALRWGGGARTYGTDVASYREYLISHEVGHGLGHDHVPCPGPGRPAPVMTQQTKSLEGCRRNPWPHPDRRAAAGREHRGQAWAAR